MCVFYLSFDFLILYYIFRKYATIVFLTSNRFETSKRRLSYLTFDDFSNCALAMMTSWTTQEEKSESLDDCDLEKEFLIQLRELKVVLEKEKEHKKLVLFVFFI